MKRFITSIIYITCIVELSFGLDAMAQTPNENAQVGTTSQNNIPQGAQRLIEAYPAQQLRYENNGIVFPDGISIVYDDGKEKSFEEMLDNSDLEDMFKVPYRTEGEPNYLEDAGRSRCEAFYKKMYGSNAGAVKKTLVSVPWFGKSVKFTNVNGAAEQLGKVAKEIEEKHPELKKYMESSGTFYWRQVRGATRQSAHSYGIAIDIGVHFSDYWHWADKKATETTEIPYRNRIPLEIVEVFERHGFVWGGRWYHFDTMHFEYRPDINPIQKASDNTIK